MARARKESRRSSRCPGAWRRRSGSPQPRAACPPSANRNPDAPSPRRRSRREWRATRSPPPRRAPRSPSPCSSARRSPLLNYRKWPCPRYLTPAQRRLSRTRGRMLRAPVPGDLAARGEPHAPAALGVLEEAGEPARPARAARDPAVQTHRHHPRLGRALLPELVEGVAEIGGEVVRHLERATPEADVVGVERIGNDEPRTGRARHVIGQVVRVRVAVEQERRLGHHELARVDGRAIAAVPAHGRLARRLLDGGNGARNGCALRLPVHEPVLLPAIAVGADVPAARKDRKSTRLNSSHLVISYAV